ncbi:MAG: hypothetical protein D6698_05005 [Gammaproteobacteria bacterium]|nr:MAG: hypothetical protein D6698_05005 [Gammaproteobacteria bacterium]
MEKHKIQLEATNTIAGQRRIDTERHRLPVPDFWDGTTKLARDLHTLETKNTAERVHRYAERAAAEVVGAVGGLLKGAIGGAAGVVSGIITGVKGISPLALKAIRLQSGKNIYQIGTWTASKQGSVHVAFTHNLNLAPEPSESTLSLVHAKRMKINIHSEQGMSEIEGVVLPVRNETNTIEGLLILVEDETHAVLLFLDQ